MCELSESRNFFGHSLEILQDEAELLGDVQQRGAFLLKVWSEFLMAKRKAAVVRLDFIVVVINLLLTVAFLSANVPFNRCFKT